MIKNKNIFTLKILKSLYKDNKKKDQIVNLIGPNSARKTIIWEKEYFFLYPTKEIIPTK